MVRFYKWNYSWKEMRELYIQKNKEHADKMNAFCTFLCELVSSAFGGGKSSDDEVNLDTGEGLDEMTDQQLEDMKAMLGETDFNRLYGHLI